MALVGNIHQVLVPAVVNNHNILRIALEGKDIEIVKSLLVGEESSGKRANSRSMRELTLFMADDFSWLPNMHTLDNMGIVPGILSIVDDSFLPKLWDNLRMEENHITNAEIEVYFSLVNFVDPIFGDFVWGCFVGQVVVDVRAHNISVQVYSKFAWIVCGEIGCGIVSFLVDCHIIAANEIDLRPDLALLFIWWVGVTWGCNNNHIFGTTYFTCFTQAHRKHGCTDLEERDAWLISDKESVVVSVELKFDFAAVVIDDVVGIGVGTGSSGENPSVVDFEQWVSWIGGIGSTLNNHELIIDDKLFNMTVLHEGVLVDHNWITDVAPINFVYRMGIGKSNEDLIFKIITIDSKLSKPIFDISASDEYIIVVEDIKSIQPINIIKHEDISKVDLSINDG